MHLNKISKLATIALAVGFAGGSLEVAQAQRQEPTREERREQRRRATENMTPEQRQQYFQERMQERQRTMTPEQRARFEERRQQREAQGGGPGGGGRGGAEGAGGRGGGGRGGAQLSAVDAQRLLMQSAGVNDTAVQDAIMAFVAEQAEQRQPVKEAATQLSALLADTNSTPEAIEQQLEALRTASKEFRTWREGALVQLDAKIGYSRDPRLQSLLVLVGILGDESTDAGGYNAIFPRGVAGTGDISDMQPRQTQPTEGAAPVVAD